MLKVDDLKSQIASAIKNIVVPAIEQCIKNKTSQKSDKEYEEAKKFAESFDNQVTDQLADSLANAIDYYIKNADITGTIITVGSPTTQTAVISPPPTPVVGGKVPNTFGIN